MDPTKPSTNGKAKSGFFTISNELIDDGTFAEIGPTATLVYLVLVKCADRVTGKCWPSLSRISSDSGLNRTTVQRQLKALISAGLVRKEKQGDPATKEANVYRVTRCRKHLVEDQELGAESAQARCRKHLGLGAESTTNNTHKNNTHKNNSPRKFSDDDLATAEVIFEGVKAILPNAKKPNFVSWANTVRLMRERDGRTHAEIRDLFAWANSDSFWQSNILSPEKLRKQWDQLSIKRSNRNGKQRTRRRIGPGQRYDPTANARTVPGFGEM